MALFPVQGKRLHWVLHCLAVTIVFALAASPTLVLNTIQFHSPFKTGYDFWLPGNWSVKSALFSPNYIPNNAASLWREFILHPKAFSPARYLGTGTCFVPSFILLVCAGFAFLPLSRFIVCAFLAGFSFLAATLSYAFGEDARFYLPLLVLLVGVAVLPVMWAAENLFLARRTVASLAIFALFAAACLGYPSRSVANTSQGGASRNPMERNRSQAWDALLFPSPPREPRWWLAERHFVEMFGREPGIILTDINPVYLNALLPDPFVAAPLDGERYAGFRHVVTYDRAQALALVKRGLGQSCPVYALFVSRKEMEEKVPRLPQIDGYEWVLAKDLPAKEVVLALSPK